MVDTTLSGISPRHVAVTCPSECRSAADCRESAAKGIRATLAAVLVSVGLGAVKVIAGIVGHSYALIADGVESMLDVVSGLVVAGSLKIAAQPPDEEYPFGYGKVEPAAALGFRSPCWPRRSALRSRACAKSSRPITRRRRSRSSCWCSSS